MKVKRLFMFGVQCGAVILQDMTLWQRSKACVVPLAV